MESMLDAVAPGLDNVLEGRQFEILELMALKAMTIQEIAEHLNISASTVSTHISRAKARLRVRNVFALIGMYWQWRSPGDREYDSWMKDIDRAKAPQV